jgi:hypothetical protein
MDPPLAKTEIAISNAEVIVKIIPVIVRSPRRFGFIFLLA